MTTKIEPSGTFYDWIKIKDALIERGYSESDIWDCSRELFYDARDGSLVSLSCKEDRDNDDWGNEFSEKAREIADAIDELIGEESNIHYWW